MSDLLNAKVGTARFKKFLIELNKRESPTYELTSLIPELNMLNLFDGNPDIYIKNEISLFLKQKGGANNKHSQKGGFPPSALICYLLVIWFFGIIMVVESTRLEELYKKQDILKEKQRSLTERSTPKYGWFRNIFQIEFTRENLAEFKRLQDEITEETRVLVERDLPTARMEAETAANAARAEADNAEAVLTFARNQGATIQSVHDSNQAAVDGWKQAVLLAQNQYNIRDVIAAGGLGMAITAIVFLYLRNQDLQRNQNYIPRLRAELANENDYQIDSRLPHVRDDIGQPIRLRREIDNVAAPGNVPQIPRLGNGEAAPQVIVPPPPGPQAPGFNSPRGRRPPSGGRTKSKKGKPRRKTKKI